MHQRHALFCHGHHRLRCGRHRRRRHDTRLPNHVHRGNRFPPQQDPPDRAPCLLLCVHLFRVNEGAGVGWGVRVSDAVADSCRNRWFSPSTHRFINSSNPTSTPSILRCGCSNNQIWIRRFWRGKGRGRGGSELMARPYTIPSLERRQSTRHTHLLEAVKQSIHGLHHHPLHGRGGRHGGRWGVGRSPKQGGGGGEGRGTAAAGGQGDGRPSAERSYRGSRSNRGGVGRVLGRDGWVRLQVCAGYGTPSVCHPHSSALSNQPKPSDCQKSRGMFLFFLRNPGRCDDAIRTLLRKRR